MIADDRTPMNITAVGLDLVVEVVKELGDQAPPFLLSTVEACQSSCNSSLEVSNGHGHRHRRRHGHG